jgi:hypothetical protein
MRSYVWPTAQQLGDGPFHVYNCAVHSIEKPYPSVAMTCSDGLTKLIPLPSGLESLQVVRLHTVQRIQWMYFPRMAPGSFCRVNKKRNQPASSVLANAKTFAPA